MSLFPCSVCGQRQPGKYSSVTWAWWRADNVRVAYRQRLCVSCFAMNVAPLEVATRDASLSCPVCHTEPGDDMDPTYITAYLPGVGAVRVEMATCSADAVMVRNSAQVGADRLDDRGSQFGGQDPGPRTDAPLDPWKALGIEPRE